MPLIPAANRRSLRGASATTYSCARLSELAHQLQSTTGRVERSLGTSDRVQAELLALPMIAEHKRALLAARPRLEAARAPQYGPGLHIGPDGGRLFATERELHHLDLKAR